MKFNPDVHSAVVCYYRRAYKQKYNQECTLPDKRIWDITEEWVGLEDTLEAAQEAALEQMHEENPA